MITLPNKLGLLEHLRGLGWVLRLRVEGCTGLSPAGVEDDAALLALVQAYNPLAAAKAARVLEIKADGLLRIQGVFPAVDNFDLLKLVVSIMQSIVPAAKQLTADMQKASAIWQAGLNAIQAVNAATTLSEVSAVVPAWPV